MATTDSYREYSPSAALAGHVSCFWCAESNTSPAGREHRVLPDGCIDFVFDVSEGLFSAGKVVGTMTKPLAFQTTGPTKFVAVRFLPGGATPFLKISASELTDSQVELPLLWGDEGLGEQLREVSTSVARVRRLERALMRRLPQVAPVDGRVQLAVAEIQRAGRTTESVAAELGLSRQHVTRLFRQHVGIGPKTFDRVMRMQRLSEQVRGLSVTEWAEVAVRFGFFDQAHMINECRSLTGLSPAQLASR